MSGCNAGYYAMNNECTGCPAGTYKSAAGNSFDLCVNCTADQFLSSSVSSTDVSDCGKYVLFLEFND